MKGFGDSVMVEKEIDSVGDRKGQRWKSREFLSLTFELSVDDPEASEPRREDIGEGEPEGVVDRACEGVDGSNLVRVMSKRDFKLLRLDPTVSLTMSTSPKLAGSEVPEPRERDRLTPCMLV